MCHFGIENTIYCRFGGDIVAGQLSTDRNIKTVKHIYHKPRVSTVKVWTMQTTHPEIMDAMAENGMYDFIEPTDNGILLSESFYRKKRAEGLAWAMKRISRRKKLSPIAMKLLKLMIISGQFKTWDDLLQHPDILPFENTKKDNEGVPRISVKTILFNMNNKGVSWGRALDLIDRLNPGATIQDMDSDDIKAIMDDRKMNYNKAIELLEGWGYRKSDE